ncbi:MAG TPA: 2Fe-2S iron-sulfur cluster-binding protein [Bacteroidales bacterium]|nr:2Fe-2S iron-sulfur cluster-binding protein [Bacteroidales bacterium]
MKLTIDNRTIEISSQLTVLEAAEQNGIFIPKMCAHPELIPYGGCRLCIIEIEGVKGYPTSCTTQAVEGMIVRTDTNTLQEMRKDLVQLILSEHPSACLLCGDIEGCSEFQQTIRKVGITTGCRWCPKDMDCELQRIVESFGINELTLPGLYRDLPVEKYDPFFDRDYNLCIYCGRCVRICNEYRRSSVLSLRQRGKHTTIGPAFDMNHTDADCEYCGACVSVCPTGAMSEKSRKWWGIPDAFKPSVCPLCSMNCEIQTLTLKNKIVGTIPRGIPHETAGELCVKGRFCLSELVNRTKRVLEPQYLYSEGYGIVSWDEASGKGGEILRSVEPGRSAIFISPDLSLEEYMAAKIFADKILKTNDITSSCLDTNLISYTSLASSSASVDEIRNAGVIVSLFLNGNYNYAPLTMAVKAAASNDIPYYQIGWVKDTTSRYATHRLVPDPGDELKILDQIIGCISSGKSKDPVIGDITSRLKDPAKGMIICGPGILSLSNCIPILEKIEKIIEGTRAKLFMPDPHGNLKGMLSVLPMKPVESVKQKIGKGDIDLLYFIGDIPYSERPQVKYLIYQNAFPAPEGLNPDLILSASLWGENGGTWPGANGSPLKVDAAAPPHDYALSHIEVLSRLSSASGVKGVKILPGTAKSKLKPQLPAVAASVNGKTKNPSPGNKLPYILVQERSPHRYQGVDLSRAVGGLSDLIKTGHAVINPSDAKTIGAENGDTLQISSCEGEKEYPVTIRKNIPKGVVYLTTLNGNSDFKTNPCYVNIRRAHV